MDVYMPILTTVRHNRITMTFAGTVLELLRRNEVHALQEECALVYWGTKELPNGFELVNVESIEDIKYFIENVITELEYVRPDFVLFKNNAYIENKRQTRTAGKPDLIVEVWSESNTKNDRAFLQNLYATSNITEHWYIEQDSNEVECYFGRNKINGQSLADILITQNGLAFDLRYLAR
jgi:DNA polymerase elongation subunit (family B)